MVVENVYTVTKASGEKITRVNVSGGGYIDMPKGHTYIVTKASGEKVVRTNTPSGKVFEASDTGKQKIIEVTKTVVEKPIIQSKKDNIIKKLLSSNDIFSLDIRKSPSTPREPLYYGTAYPYKSGFSPQVLTNIKTSDQGTVTLTREDAYLTPEFLQTLSKPPIVGHTVQKGRYIPPPKAADYSIGGFVVGAENPFLTPPVDKRESIAGRGFRHISAIAYEYELRSKQTTSRGASRVYEELPMLPIGVIRGAAYPIVKPKEFISGFGELFREPVPTITGMAKMAYKYPLAFTGEWIGTGATLGLAGKGLKAGGYDLFIKPIVKANIFTNKNVRSGTYDFLNPKIITPLERKQAFIQNPYIKETRTPFIAKKSSAEIFGGYKLKQLDIYGNPVSDVRIDLARNIINKQYAPYGLPKNVNGIRISAEYNLLRGKDLISSKQRILPNTEDLIYYKIEPKYKYTSRPDLTFTPFETINRYEPILRKYQDIKAYSLTPHTATQKFNLFNHRGNIPFILKDTSRNIMFKIRNLNMFSPADVKYKAQANLFGDVKIERIREEGFLSKAGYNLEFGKSPEIELLALKTPEGNLITVVEKGRPQMKLIEENYFKKNILDKIKIYDNIKDYDIIGVIKPKVDRSIQSTLFPKSKKVEVIGYKGRSRNTLAELYGKSVNKDVIFEEIIKVDKQPVSVSVIKDKPQKNIPKGYSTTSLTLSSKNMKNNIIFEEEFIMSNPLLKSDSNKMNINVYKDSLLLNNKQNVFQIQKPQLNLRYGLLLSQKELLGQKQLFGLRQLQGNRQTEVQLLELKQLVGQKQKSLQLLGLKQLQVQKSVSRHKYSFKSVSTLREDLFLKSDMVKKEDLKIGFDIIKPIRPKTPPPRLPSLFPPSLFPIYPKSTSRKGILRYLGKPKRYKDGKRKFSAYVLPDLWSVELTERKGKGEAIMPKLTKGVRKTFNALISGENIFGRIPTRQMQREGKKKRRKLIF